MNKFRLNGKIVFGVLLIFLALVVLMFDPFLKDESRLASYEKINDVVQKTNLYTRLNISYSKLLLDIKFKKTNAIQIEISRIDSLLKLTSSNDLHIGKQDSHVHLLNFWNNLKGINLLKDNKSLSKYGGKFQQLLETYNTEFRYETNEQLTSPELNRLTSLALYNYPDYYSAFNKYLLSVITQQNNIDTTGFSVQYIVLRNMLQTYVYRISSRFDSNYLGVFDDFVEQYPSFPFDEIDNEEKIMEISEQSVIVFEYLNYLHTMFSNNNIDYLRKITLVFPIISVLLSVSGLLMILSGFGSFYRKIPELEKLNGLIKSGEFEEIKSMPFNEQTDRLSQLINSIVSTLSTKLVENREQLEIAESMLSDEKLRHDEAEKALTKSELLLKEVWSISADGMRISDVDGNIITANDAYCKMVYMKLEDMEGQHFTTVYHDSVKKKFKQFYEEDFSEERVVTHFDRESILWNKKNIWFSFANSHLHTDSGILVLSIIKDITERKKYEKEIKESAKQLRNLASHLQSVREEERMMIAREIHDELGQVLTVLKIQISLLSNKLRDDQSNLKEKVKTAMAFIDQTVESVQRITSKLRPGILDDLGLVPAIEWQAKDFEERTGVICELSMPTSSVKLDQEKATAIFRIFQETLTNVARHANATKIQIRFQVKDNKYVLRITDNGKGITEKEISDYNSLGLLGMKERALLLNGEFIITGVPAKGTTVYVNIPIESGDKNK